jgi:hypothetical protein
VAPVGITSAWPTVQQIQHLSDECVLALHSNSIHVIFFLAGPDPLLSLLQCIQADQPDKSLGTLFVSAYFMLAAMACKV